MIGNTEIIDGIFKYNVPLKNYTSFKVGGVAEVFAEPGNISELREVLKFCKDEKKNIFVLGNGSNVLVGDGGVRGVVIHVGGVGFKNVKREGNYVYSQAGVNLSYLVREAALWGLGGLEVLVGIPGTVGGAVIMNAGGKYGAISETLKCVTVMDFDGEIKKYDCKDIEFTYRGCNLNNQIIVEVGFMLKESKKEMIFERMDKMFSEKKERQPLSTFNAGCIFKNTKDYKAAELIEKAGLKGASVGGAMVSDRHSNFIINTGCASSDDIQDLMDMVKETVKERFDVTLTPEIQMW